jgi:hypothetical protein
MKVEPNEIRYTIIPHENGRFHVRATAPSGESLIVGEFETEKIAADWIDARLKNSGQQLD